MPALVPTLGAELERLVVALLVLLDEPFQTDVAPDLETEMIGYQQHEQARHAAVAVPERVNAQEIEVQGPEGDERLDAALGHDLLPARNQFGHGGRYVRGPDRPKADRAPAVGEHFYNVIFGLFILARVSNAAPRQGMQPTNRLLRDRQTG